MSPRLLVWSQPQMQTLWQARTRTCAWKSPHMPEMWHRGVQDWFISSPEISLQGKSSSEEKEIFNKSVPDLQKTCTQRKLCQAYQNPFKEKEACVTQLWMGGLSERLRMEHQNAQQEGHYNPVTCREIIIVAMQEKLAVADPPLL